MVIIWPIVQSGINAFGIWIANSSSTSPIFAPFIYGTLERLLLPFGLHHMLTIPMNYTAFGGTYVLQTGINAGSEVFGQDPLWLAWVTDLINFKDAGDMAAYTNLMETVTPARFKVGQMIGATGLLMGIALAMYRRVDSDKKHDYRSMFFSTVLAVFLTGVTEPLEFMFMFCALPLYVVYAILQGCAFAMAGIFDLRVHSFGNLEFLTRVPMSLKAGLSGDIINFIICCVAFLIIGYVVAYFMIGKFQFATPGRLGNYENEGGEEETTAGGENKGGGNSQPERIIALLGGRENIVLVDACMTRLRVTVKDPSKVADTPAWKAEGAKGFRLHQAGITCSWTWVSGKIGYGIYDEGMALLCLNGNITAVDSFFISGCQDYQYWKTRKILGVKTSNCNDWFYTVHMGWWKDEEEPFLAQWERLHTTLKKKDSTIWLMGDFNSPAQFRGQGYDTIQNSGWQDTYSIAEQKDNGITVEGSIDGWKDAKHGAEEGNGMRMDHIWCNHVVPVKYSKVMFHGAKEPKVSDHFGVCIEV